jgi:hypothetical protein
MTPRRSNRYFVIVMRWVLRGTRAADSTSKRLISRSARAMNSSALCRRAVRGVSSTITCIGTNAAARRVAVTITSPVRRGVEQLVRWVGGDGDGAKTLTVCVLVAAAGAGAFCILGAYAGTGTSELVDIAAALAVGALAVGAAVILVRRRLGHGDIDLRSLVQRAIARIDPQHQHGPAVRALTVACEPSTLLPTRQALPQAAQYVARRALKKLVKHPTRHVPMLGSVLDLFSAYQTTVGSARFVQQFALTAVEVCCDAAA